nr:N-6 DNA methylase [uncultured Methanobrevibacter sp.]
MRPNSKKSDNYSILKNLISKSRNFKLPDEIDYIVIYTFLYKYCSDSIKDHFLMALQDKEMTLDEAYKSNYYQEVLKEDSMHLYGFHIEKPDAFIDEVINNFYSDRFFLSEFFSIFPKNITFAPDSKDKKYFEFLFKTLSQEIKIDKYEFESEIKLAIKEIIYAISKLDLFETEFPFSSVFEVLTSSKLMHIQPTPEYISQLLSTLISCDKTSIKNAYDPFLMDGNTLLSLSEKCELGVTYYGKESDRLTYCYAITRFLINYFNLNYVEFRNEDATESIDIDGASFDVILSKIPLKIRNYYSSKENQNREIIRRNKRNELEKVLRNEFNMNSDSFTKDSELNSALENLLEKIDVESSSDIEFSGEYESLKDSEFLFLINLIESLKYDGIMAISISQNFLFKNSLQTLRKYLTFEKNYVDTIISVPEEIGRRRPEVIIVFRKNRSNQGILFIDISNDYKTQKNRILFPGLFRRNLIFSDETIDKISDVYSKKLTIDKFSNLISISEIAKNDFNLSVSRYVDTFEGKFIRLSDLKQEKAEIDANIQELNLKIEKMMDELDIRF